MTLEDRLRSGKKDVPEADTLTVIKANTIKLTVGELKGQLKNSTDPRAIAAIKSVKDMPEQSEIVMEREDLLSIIDGKEVNLNTVMDENGNKVITKSLSQGTSPMLFDEDEEDA